MGPIGGAAIVVVNSGQQAQTHALPIEAYSWGIYLLMSFVWCVIGAMFYGLIYAPTIKILFSYAFALRWLRRNVWFFIKIPGMYNHWSVIGLCPFPVPLESTQRPWTYYSEEQADAGIAKMKADRNLINAEAL